MTSYSPIKKEPKKSEQESHPQDKTRGQRIASLIEAGGRRLEDHPNHAKAVDKEDAEQADNKADIVKVKAFVVGTLGTSDARCDQADQKSESQPLCQRAG